MINTKQTSFIYYNGKMMNKLIKNIRIHSKTEDDKDIFR